MMYKKLLHRIHSLHIPSRVLAFLLLALCVHTFPAFAYSASGNAPASKTDDAIFRTIDNYLSSLVPKTHFPSLSITIVDKNEVLFSKAYGNAQGTDAPYVLGSVSKSFTALCIMQLVEQGKISLDEKLSAYIPDATDGERITILQLLNHTSGLGEHQNLTNYKIVSEQGVHQYANVNYSLLGKVVETASGMSYEEYVSQNVFEPLALKSTFANPRKAETAELMPGYENWFGLNVKTASKYRDSADAWITVPAGYISSSTEDLGRYLQMYLNGGKGIISQDSINEMFYNSVAVEDDIPYRYGMGWTLINEPLPAPALRHSGLVENGMSCVYILPENGIGVAIAVNANDYFVGADFADRLGWGVILLLMGEEPNQIGRSEFVLRHLMYDALYLLVLIASSLPLVFFRKYKKLIAKLPLAGKIAWLLFAHLALPIFILLLTTIFFGTPLQVVRAFVPDLFSVVIVSAALLLAGGMCGIRRRRDD